MSDTRLDPRTNPPEPRQRRSAVAVAVALLILVGLVAALLVAGTAFLRDRFADTAVDDYPGPGRGSVTVEVLPGDTAQDIAETLVEEDVVKTTAAFVEAAAADERSRSIQPGFYELPRELPAADALALLLDPSARVQARVTVPEGLRLDRAVALLADGTGLSAKSFRRVLAQPRRLDLPPYAGGNAEGFLLPATYDVNPGTGAHQLLQAMVRRFAQAERALDLRARAAQVGLDPYDVVIVASLIEGEARHPEDFGKVSRVVQNRLAAGMPLQFDSTVNYALQANKTLVTHEDLGVDSLYNTYKYAGLPPGPISSPGEAALEAALTPTPGDWLYFVTVDPESGETKFTADYDEFLRFKQELKANTG